MPRLDHPPIKMVQFTGEAYTVAGCFKHRNKIGMDVALEALKDALSPDRSGGRVSFDDLWRCAKVCCVANVMRPCMEAVA